MRGPGDLAEYSRVHRQFLTDWLPPLLLREVERRPAATMVDLGCGDGAVISGLMNRGLLPERVYAVDLSPERVDRAAALHPGVTGVVADGTDVAELPDGCADAVISSQVIEHVPDQAAFVREIARLLRPGGWWYVGSVLRGRGAWWIYQRDGRRWLDPTHVREYESRDEYVSALRADGLVIETVRSEPTRFPVPHLAVRAGVLLGVLQPEVVGRLSGSGSMSRLARSVRLRVPGYRLIEATGHRL